MLSNGLRTKRRGLAGWEPPCSLLLPLVHVQDARAAFPLRLSTGSWASLQRVCVLSVPSSPAEFAHVPL